MKRSNLIVFALFLLAATLIAGCTSYPPAAPSPTPSGGEWARILESGTLTVGTSGDYPPFSFYDDEFRLTGFDPEMARALGEELGVEVRILDIPFDGLYDALDVGQIDAAVSAISVTPEREQRVDFTDVYYISEDAFLARPDTELIDLTSIEEVQSQTRVGVQQGSVYEAWAQEELVDTGLIPKSNLLLYSDMELAVRDLQRSRIDLVILDANPAEQFAADGSVKVVARGLNQQLYAIAVVNGGNELRRKLNEALEQLRIDGTMNELAEEFFGANAGIVPGPSVTATPTPVATPIPLPTKPITPAPPARCLDSMAWVADLNYDDQNMQNPPVLSPGQSFVKGWRVRNTGTCTWTSAYRLAYVQGNVPGAQMSGQPAYVTGRVAPNALYDFNVPLIAPLVPGTYQGFWQMFNELNAPFGQRIWVGITVAAPVTATPRPTQTPVAQITFTASPTSIIAGSPVRFTWATQNVKEVYFYREGQNWWDNGVAGVGERTEYPPRTMSYFLRVVNRDNTVVQREQRISVTAAPNAPVISQFSVVPDGTINLGQCVQINWSVSGDVRRVDITRNGNAVWDNAPLRGDIQDCPTPVGDYEYRLTATGGGGTSVATRLVYVRATTQPTPTAVPTNAPTVVPPAVVQQFSVTPGQIMVGNCVSIVWAVGGDPALIQIKRNGVLLFDYAPISGSGQDCPPNPGNYVYRIEVTNRAGQVSDAREATTSVLAPDPTAVPTAVPTYTPIPTPVPTDAPTPIPTETPTAVPTVPQPPVINYFALSAEQITLGECVTLSWSFMGQDLAASRIQRNGVVLMQDPPLNGDLVDCPTETGDQIYQLQVSSEFAGTTEESRLLQVYPPIEPR